MGWTSSHRSSVQSVKEYLIDEINQVGLKSTFKVLDIAIVKRNTAYLAVKRTEHDSGNSEVFAMVILIRYSRGHFNLATKEMSEEMGPCYYDCPARILDLLSPTSSPEAVRWREKCRAHLISRELLKKDLAAAQMGSVFNFGKPVEFTKGGKYEKMTFHHRDNRRYVFLVGAYAMAASFEKLLEMKHQYGLEAASND